MRAASLRSFSGHAALPGGKADSKEETPCMHYIHATFKDDINLVG